MRRWLPLAGVAALLGAALLAATFGNPSIEQRSTGPQPSWEYNPPAPEDPTHIFPTDPPPFAESPPILPAWIGWVITGVCAAFVLVVVALLIWFFLRDRLQGLRAPAKAAPTDPPELSRTRRRMREALEEGIADLDDADSDPRRAVIACWLRLEAEAAQAGTPREAGDTSTDLVARLLRSHQISADILADFAAVYRLARFAPQHAVDEAMRDRARTALRRVHDELAAAQPVPEHQLSAGAGTEGAP
ncbi:MAG TPA: DUF4129 domain-containing protein [Micromonosporaceae bacterium]|nr:DUF4129 domain-containing protein [Micromonosporaceae bacterium]